MTWTDYAFKKPNDGQVCAVIHKAHYLPIIATYDENEWNGFYQRQPYMAKGKRMRKDTKVTDPVWWHELAEHPEHEANEHI